MCGRLAGRNHVRRRKVMSEQPQRLCTTVY
ncbi:hypothetical protein E2C01_080790 [Portunus trituberculatus]|uniref:Uncharacterized protein n=1 Tax=Portunus trituberculatus TaxID=210409 RepID=A0A5B7IKJ5_PORTR|nr:hypothetical protein [Portunus trituberculatus]